MPPAGPEKRSLAAIMFTDMVGYSALSQRNQKLAQELLEEHRALLRSVFPSFNGTEIKTMGDAFLVEFQSALESAQCGIEIQRALAKRNHEVPIDRRIEVKIGIHIGDVVHRDGDVYGDGVNIASRIEPLAGAGGICVSMDVERQIRNALEARFEKLAPTELKNISMAMDLFRIVLPWEANTQRDPGSTRILPGSRALASRASDQPGPRSAARWGVGLGAMVLLLIGIGAGLYFRNAGAAHAALQRNYDQAFKAGQTALIAEDYDEAIRQADLALGFKVTDPAATQVKVEAQDRRNRATLAAVNQLQYQNALAAGRKALEAQRFDEAIRHADLALGLKVQDPSAAVQLKATAQAQKNLADLAMVVPPSPASLDQEKYDQALKAGQSALAANNYAEAIRQADRALNIQVKEKSAALQLKKEAQAPLATPAPAKARRQEELIQLDSELHILLVRFGIWNSIDSRIQPTEQARAEKKLGVLGQAKTQYQKRLAVLKRNYEGLLPPSAEQFNLIREIDNSIKNWE